MARPLPTGIRRTFDKDNNPTGYQTYRWKIDPTRKHGGYQASKRWPPSATIAEMTAWRKEQELRGKRPDLFLEPDETTSTFARDARDDYLQRETVKAMPTYEERVQHMEWWIRQFGHRERSSIQPPEIQKALDGLRARLSPASVNKRRSALMHFYTTLNGRHQANPVKATTVFEEPHPEPRAPELVAVLKLLRGMPASTDYGRKCRARVKVIAWTGWPHAIVKQLAPSDHPYWQQGRAFVPRRRKGKGARARWLPLLPEAVKALHEFHRVHAYGHFSNSSLHKRVTETCKRLKLPHIRPYDLRHFYGSLVASLTRDERVIMELLLVTTPKIIRRYTDAATDPRVQSAMEGIAQQLPGVLAAAKRTRKRGTDSRTVLPKARNTRNGQQKRPA